MVKHNKYSLAHIGPFHINGHEEMNIMLELEQEFNCKSSFNGTVFDAWCHPIEAATVRIYDMDEKLLTQRKTNKNGDFIFDHINQGHYLVAASADGYLLSEFKAIKIKENETNKLDIFLKRNPLEIQGILYGRVLDAESCLPIKDSEVLLLNTNGRLYASTFTNEDGQFLIYNIKPEYYFIFASHSKYEESICALYKVKSGSKLLHNFSLLPKQDNHYLINGRLVGEKGTLGAHMPVFLFQVTEEHEELLKTQISNSKGLYCFDDLHDGDYIVKAKISDEENFLEKYSFWN